MLACSLPGFLSMGFSQQYWSGLPHPPPGSLSNSGIEPESPALQADSLLLSHQGSPSLSVKGVNNIVYPIRLLIKLLHSEENRNWMLSFSSSQYKHTTNTHTWAYKYTTTHMHVCPELCAQKKQLSIYFKKIFTWLCWVFTAACGVFVSSGGSFVVAPRA